MDRRKSGDLAEQFVAQSLEDNGYHIRARNYQKPYGEIDIIAQKNDTIAYIEVKYRKNPLFDIATIITHSKQKKIIMVAKEYMARYNLNRHILRFDVAFISHNNDTFELEYIENAFQE